MQVFWRGQLERFLWDNRHFLDWESYDTSFYTLIETLLHEKDGSALTIGIYLIENYNLHLSIKKL